MCFGRSCFEVFGAVKIVKCRRVNVHCNHCISTAIAYVLETNPKTQSKGAIVSYNPS